MASAVTSSSGLWHHHFKNARCCSPHAAETSTVCCSSCSCPQVHLLPWIYRLFLLRGCSNAAVVALMWSWFRCFQLSCCILSNTINIDRLSLGCWGQLPYTILLGLLDLCSNCVLLRAVMSKQRCSSCTLRLRSGRCGWSNSAVDRRRPES